MFSVETSAQTDANLTQSQMNQLRIEFTNEINELK